MKRLWDGILARSSGLRRLRSRLWYQYVSRKLGDEPVLFLNYGYAPSDDRPPVELPQEFEPERSAAQLYLHVAGAVDLAGRDVVEVGCGRGGGASFVKRLLKPRSILGIDHAEHAVGFACRRHLVDGLSFAPGDAENLPLADRSVDAVLNIESSHCYGDMEGFVAEVERVLRPGGHFLFADLGDRARMARVREMFVRSGLDIVKEEKINANVLKAMEQDSEKKLGLVKRFTPWFLRGAGKEFAGLKKSAVHRMLRSEEILYMHFVLRRTALHVLIFLLGTFAGLTASLPADGTHPPGMIRGFVLDAESRRGIEGASLTVWREGKERPSERTAVSDKGGAFSVPDLPAGTYLCLFEREGYAPRTLETVRVAGGSSTLLDVELDRSPAPLREEITVTAPALAENAGRTAGAVAIEGERLRRTPGSIDDVSRVLKSTVGLSQVNDISNELIVRGGSPWENAFFIDGIPFYDINHFQTQGGSGGMVGFINASWVRSMSFFKGGFPAAFGDRMSSVIDLAFREGERERLRGQVDLNTAGFGGGMEGPILGGRGSFLLSGKRSYHDIITGLLGYGVAPRLGDFHFKAVTDLGSRHRLELLNVNADSRMAFDIERAVAEGFTRGLNYKTRQHTLGLSWTAGWSPSFSTVTTLSWSHFLNLDELEDVITRDAVYLMDEAIDIVGLRHTGTLVPGNRLRLTFGLETRAEIYDFNNIYGKAYSLYGTMLPKFVVRGDLRTKKAAAFASADWTPVPKLSLSFGARVDHFSHNRSTEASPRVSASWEVRPRFMLKAAAGIFRQALPTTIMGVSPGTRGNRNPWAGHILFGLSHEPAEGFLLSLDIYDKSYRRMPLTPEEPDFPVFDSCLGYGIYRSFTIVTDDGRARSRGLELSLEKKPGGIWHGIIGLSLFKSRFQDALGRWRDRLNDNRYVLTVIGAVRLARLWNIGLRSDLAGGVPYTPFDLERSREVNSAILDTSRIDEARYPDYVSLSLRADREFRFKKTVLLAYVSILNALNRKNVGRFYWDRISNEPGVIHQMPIIPVFGLEYRF